MKLPGEGKLQRFFGDFGGDYNVNSTSIFRFPDVIPLYESTLQSETFDRYFNECLAEIIDPDYEIRSFTSASGVSIDVVEDYSIEYNIAGQFALALALDRDTVYIGTYFKDVALMCSKLCNKYDLKLKIWLSSALSKDEDLVLELQKYGDVDSTSCEAFLDEPHAYIGAPFTDPAPGLVINDTANYGTAPSPALAGLLASIFGVDIKNKSNNRHYDGIVVPVVEGTNAIGTMKSYLDSGSVLMTVEETIAQEYHMTDHSCYTLSVRRADHNERNITLAPELVYWWRQALVKRLGCDRFKKVDYQDIEHLKLNELTKRAIALALEDGDYSSLLVVEAKEHE